MTKRIKYPSRVRNMLKERQFKPRSDHVWSQATLDAIDAFEYTLARRQHGDFSRIINLATVLEEVGNKTIVKAYQRASLEICSLDVWREKDCVRTKFNKEHDRKNRVSPQEKIEELRDKTLRIYRSAEQRRKLGPSDALKNIHEVHLNSIRKNMNIIREIEGPDSQMYQNFLNEIEILLSRIECRIEDLRPLS